MKKYLLTIGFLSFSLSVVAQVVCNVDNSGLFYVGENSLVYSGGGIQTKGSGIFDVHGNMMVVGTGADVIRTQNSAGSASKIDGGNIILRVNNPTAVGAKSLGQLYINGVSQSNITAIVDKEFRTAKHGTYQQIALPFHNKTISTLSAELGKTFGNARYSKNEVLVYDNVNVVAANLNLSSVTPKSTSYYMLGSKNLDTANPPITMVANSPAATGSVYTLRGVPYANGVVENLTNGGALVNFGATGNNKNSYKELYNSYVEDVWDLPSNPSAPFSMSTFGRNTYQFGNPYLTNLDLTYIGITEPGTTTDGNAITSIQGIQVDPGTVANGASGGTTMINPKFINFTAGAPDGTPIPVGDLDLTIQPMQTFIVKLRDNNAEVGVNKTLHFDGLRRFKNAKRASGTNYSVTAAKNASVGTVKQLGIIAMNAANEEIARTYFVVYPNATTGQTSKATVQSVNGANNILGTFEEDAVNGGIDNNFKNAYWLYINEANESDFLGKALPLMLYGDQIKSLKFEIRENAGLIDDQKNLMSSGIGFYVKSPDGKVSEIKQNESFAVTGDQYNLFYGEPSKVLGTAQNIKPSRTKVVFSKSSDAFVVLFDSNWKKAEVNVFDMSGKLIVNEKNIVTDHEFKLNLEKHNSAYIVTAVSESGEKISAKIIR